MAKFDGKRHVDEVQKPTGRGQRHLARGGSVYEMRPGPTFGDYLARRVLAAIEAGGRRPSTWKNRNSGRAPATARGSACAVRGLRRRLGRGLYASPDAQYRASRLKYGLYRQAFEASFRRRTGPTTRSPDATSSAHVATA